MNHNVLLRELSEDRGFLASFYLSVCQRKLVAQTGETTETTSGRALEKTTGSKALFGWIPLVGLPVLAFSLQTRMKPWAFLWALAFAIYFGLKWLTWWRVKKPVRTGWRSVAYLLAFPGMDAESFVQKTKRAPAPRVREWLRAVFQAYRGLMSNLLAPPGNSTGETRLTQWLSRNSEYVGRRYASEVARHYR
jgi:hypothetical protein